MRALKWTETETERAVLNLFTDMLPPAKQDLNHLMACKHIVLKELVQRTGWTAVSKAVVTCKCAKTTEFRRNS